MRATAKSATRVVFISRYFRDLFVERFGFDPRRSEVILRACTVDGRASAEVHETLGIRRPFVLSVSNINPYKNLVELVEAFARAVRESGDNEHQLVIVGLVNFPWYLDRIRDTARRNGIENRVVITGALPHDKVGS